MFLFPLKLLPLKWKEWTLWWEYSLWEDRSFLMNHYHQFFPTIIPKPPVLQCSPGLDCTAVHCFTTTVEYHMSFSVILDKVLVLSVDNF